MSPLEEPAPPHSSRSRFCQAMLDVGAGYLPDFIRNEVLPICRAARGKVSIVLL